MMSCEKKNYENRCNCKMKIFYKLRDYFNLLGQASLPKTNCVLGNNIICLFILFNSIQM